MRMVRDLRGIGLVRRSSSCSGSGFFPTGSRSALVGLPVRGSGRPAAGVCRTCTPSAWSSAPCNRGHDDHDCPGRHHHGDDCRGAGGGECSLLGGGLPRAPGGRRPGVMVCCCWSGAPRTDRLSVWAGAARTPVPPNGSHGVLTVRVCAGQGVYHGSGTNRPRIAKSPVHRHRLHGGSCRGGSGTSKCRTGPQYGRYYGQATGVNLLS